MDNLLKSKTREEALDKSMNIINDSQYNENLKKMVEALELDKKDKLEYNKISDELLEKLAFYSMKNPEEEKIKKTTR